MRIFKISGFCLVLILCFVSLSYGFSANIKISRGIVFTIPVVLDQNVEKIRGIDIEASFDSSVIDIVHVESGTLLSNYDLDKQLKLENLIDIAFTWDGTFASGKGEILLISMKVIGEPSTKTILSLDTFLCDEKEVVGGFKYKDQFFQNIIITVDESCDIVNNNKIGLEDAISLLQIISKQKIQTNFECNPTIKSLIKVLQNLSGIHTFNTNNTYRLLDRRSEIKRIVNVSEKYGNKFKLPLIIEENTLIRGISATIKFDESILDAQSLVLTGGILENKGYKLVTNFNRDGYLTLLIYTNDVYYEGKGIYAYILFNVVDTECNSTFIDFVESYCNEKLVSGKFFIDDNTYDSVKFSTECPYTIRVSSNENGSITPSGGLIYVPENTNHTFNFTPKEGYMIDDVLIDGYSHGPINSYSFENITDNHIVYVHFVKQYIINASTNGYGYINPSGEIAVKESSDVIFSISPLNNTVATDIMVDGKSVGNYNTYTLTSINSNHEIYAKFKIIRSIYVKNPINKISAIENSDNMNINISSLFGVAGVVPAIESISITKSIYSNNNEKLVIASIEENILTLDFQKDMTGLATIEIIGKAEYCRQSIYKFNVKVLYKNKPPIIRNINDQSIDVGQSTNMINIQIYDADSPAKDIKVWAESSNPLLISNKHEHITFGGSGFIRTVQLTPRYSEYGNSNITIYASDGKTISSTSFNLNVINREYTIQSNVGSNGKTNHPNQLKVQKGQKVTYRFIPDNGYAVDKVIIDDLQLGSIDTYRFWSVSESHNISVTFKENKKYFVTAEAQTGGKINPSGNIELLEGKNKLFIVTPSSGYEIKNIIVDGSPVGAVQKYLVKEINKTHTITALFEQVYPPNAPGGTDQTTNHITVYSEYVDFIADKTRGNSPLEIVFSDISEGYTITCWNFGDGYTSNDNNPLHIYSEPGIYSVTATVLQNEKIYSKTKRNMIVVKGRTISGRVTVDDLNSGINNCLVEVWKSKSKLVGFSLTDSDGYYTLTNLPAISDMVIGVWPSPGMTGYQKQYYKNKHNRNLANPLSTLNNDLSNINFVLQKRSQHGFQGRIISETGKGIPNFQVNTFSDIVAYGTSTITDENGYYTFTGLSASNDYKVYIWCDELKTRLYYAIPDGEHYTRYSPTVYDSVRNEKNATLINTQIPGLKNIDIFVYKGGTIKGIVMADGVPIDHIWVKAWSELLNTGSAALTDENGYYTISGLISESDFRNITYIVEIDSPNYLYQAYSNTSIRNNAIPITTDSIEVNFLLNKDCTISGFVLDENGIPVPFVDVRAWSISNPLIKNGIAQSNLNGKYSITNLTPANDYIVAVYPKTYPVQYYNGRYNKKDATVINVRTGNVNNINFKLIKQGIIYGNVYILNEKEELISAGEGIHVNIWSRSENKQYNVFTDKFGEYEISCLDEYTNDYIVSIRHSGYMPAFYRQDNENYYTTVYNVADAIGLEPSDNSRDIVLKKGYNIQGKVTYKNKKIGGIIIEVWSNSMFYGKTLSTNNQVNESNFKVGDLKQGLYTIIIKSNYYKQQTRQIEINNDISDIHIELEDLANRMIIGKISNINKGKHIKLCASSKSINFKKEFPLFTTEQNFPYTISELKPASDYILELYSSDYPYQVYNQRNKRINATYIDLLSKNFYGADFSLYNECNSIYGKIEFPENAKYGEEVSVHISSKSVGLDKDLNIVYTGVNPVNYTIDGLIKSNDYIVVLKSEKYKTQYYNNVSKRNKAQPIDITTQSVDNINFTLSNGRSISGIIFENGNPAEGIVVYAESIQKQSFGISTSLADGSYMIGGLEPADDYLIKVTRNGSPSLFYNDCNTVNNVKLASSISTLTGNVSNINIIINKGQSISGYINNEEGQPLSNIKIKVWSEIKMTGYICYSRNDGSYIADGLPQANDYQVIALPGNNLPYIPQNKNNIKGNSSDINFILIKGFNLLGTIQDTESNLLDQVRIEVRSANKNFLAISKTDKSGQFIFNGIPKAEDYEISIFPSNISNLLPMYMDNIVINSDSRKDITLMHGYKISGFVYDSSEVPISEVYITTFSAEEDYQKQVMSGPNGYFEINSLPFANDYIVQVISEKYVNQKKIDISAGSEVVFYLNDSGCITGSIMNASGLPMSDVFVQASSDSVNSNEPALSDDKGFYKICSLPVSINGNIIEDYIVSMHIEKYPTQYQKHKKVGDQVHFILNNNTISGKVIDSEGKSPPDGVTVRVFLFNNIENTPFMINKADSEGIFNFEGLEPVLQYKFLFIIDESNIRNNKQWTPDLYKSGDNVIFQLSETW